MISSIHRRVAILTALMLAAAVFSATVSVPVANAMEGEAFTCTRIDNADGTVTLEWTTDGNTFWSVREGTNQAFIVRIDDTPGWTGGDVANLYTIKSKIDGETHLAECMEAVEPPEFCSVVLNADDTITITHEDDGADRGWAVRRGSGPDPSYSYKADTTDLSYTDDPGPGQWSYQVRSRFAGGVKTTADCGSVTITEEFPPLTCTATLNPDETIMITHVDDGANGWSVRRGAGPNPSYSYKGPVSGGIYIDDPGAGQWSYQIRAASLMAFASPRIVAR